MHNNAIPITPISATLLYYFIGILVELDSVRYLVRWQPVVA